MKRGSQQEPILRLIPDITAVSYPNLITGAVIIHKHHNHFRHLSCPTPVGWFRAISDSTHLIRLDWNQISWKDPDRTDDVSRETINRLTTFFPGGLQLLQYNYGQLGSTECVTIGWVSWLTSLLELPSAIPH